MDRKYGTKLLNIINKEKGIQESYAVDMLMAI